MRVTENMRFNSTVNNLFSTQFQYNEVMEKLSSQKKVNRASDNPIAATKIIEIRQQKAANAQYVKNMDRCDAWISMTESKLSNAYDMLVKVNEIALGQATGTANKTTRKLAAVEVQSVIDEMVLLANSKMGGRYLFSGSRDGIAPFSTTRMDATVDSATAASENTFTGTIDSSGSYTGAVNKAYALKITNSGTLDTATYQFSTDGGRTWNGTDLEMDTGIIDLGDGINLTFNDTGGTKAFGIGDIFSVNAYSAGYYVGNNESLSLNISRGTKVDFNITGADAFTAAGGVDIIQTLYDLKNALENDDAQGIGAQMQKLDDAVGQVVLYQSLCGTKAQHIEVGRSNLRELDESLTILLSSAQDADLADLATQLAMKELALKASYAMAAKIGSATLLNYL